MEQRAEVYRGVVRAAEEARNKARQKVEQDMARLEETRCGPVDREYEKSMLDFERVCEEAHTPSGLLLCLRRSLTVAAPVGRKRIPCRGADAR